MSEQALSRFRELAGPSASGRERGAALAWWGMLMLVLTEAALFAAMIAAYFYLRWYSDAGWPPDGIADPKLERPTAMLAMLVVSGGTALAALRAAREGRRPALLVALGATLALGGAYVGVQAWDFTEKVNEFTPQTNAYGSLVYLLTGGHAMHVAVGVIIGAWIASRAARGAYPPGRHTAISVLTLYWVFLVAIMLAVYFTVTVSPYL